MFEDFKDKIREFSSNSIEKAEQTSLSPEVLEKLKQQGLDPENVTLAQLFPECLDPEDNDLSLMSGAEWEIMITYMKTRKYLVEKYPQSQEEARMLGKSWEEEPEEPCQINIAKTRGAFCWTLGWCVGYSTTHLAKLPHFPSFLSLFSARANCFDGDSDRIKLVSKPTKAQKSGVLVKQFLPAYER